ncbi:MAG: response regulator, partial [Planctomycetes bacterium]|nr:response regulator [Planctomycetota bacterium]
FVTGKSSGTGLGLALARRIVQEDAGQLSLDSTGASGTRFVIELPTRSAAPPREPDAAARAPRPGLNLLVVDDDPNLLETFSLVLSLDGHRTHTAASAQAALEAISSLDFDCVISDLRLPDQSGVELYRGACELQPELAQRFVFATGDIQNADSRHFMDHCGLPCLIKPFEIEDLRQVLARVTSRAGGPS